MWLCWRYIFEAKTEPHHLHERVPGRWSVAGSTNRLHTVRSCARFQVVQSPMFVGCSRTRRHAVCLFLFIVLGAGRLGQCPKRRRRLGLTIWESGVLRNRRRTWACSCDGDKIYAVYDVDRLCWSKASTLLCSDSIDHVSSAYRGPLVERMHDTDGSLLQLRSFCSGYATSVFRFES